MGGNYGKLGGFIASTKMKKKISAPIGKFLSCPQCSTYNPENSRFCSKCSTPLPNPDETLIADPGSLFVKDRKLKIGNFFAGRYELVEKLGRGGMGEVYKVKDLKLKRYVALKFLPPELSGYEEAKLRFIQEAQTASVLDHQNICTVYEIDETEDGQMYIAMAYYEGETLKNKIKRGPLPFAEAINIVLQVAQGLSKAHGKGIVHRDIKPANVIETSDRVLKIVDFGLAILAREARLTRTAAVEGTIAYMSSEQAKGENVDLRTDLWSLGVVFYELLTGQLPFQGENVQSMLYSIINKTPIPPMDLRKDIPEEAERIVMKCLRKPQKERYPSANRLISDLIKLKKSLEKEDFADKKKLKARKETERRQATVLFGEILGYSEMLESLETEEAALVMNRCFAILDSTIKKYGSRIEEITGGSFMVLFGTPQAIEDAPKKAINAAIELHNSLNRFNKEESLKVPLDIQIGVNTGTVIVGAISADKGYSVMGEAVNLASQLKNISKKGSIHVGPLTYRYTKDDFEYATLKPVLLKGRAKPVPLFKLLSVRERVYRARLGEERMIYSEMVGRERELDKLMLHVLKAINGEGSIINLIGEAGIGKSRLVAELSKKDELKKGLLLRGRALSFGANLSFHPIIDLLKSWARIKEDDPPGTSAQKLEHLIRKVFPEGGSEVFLFIATLMGLKLTGEFAERIKGIEGEALEKLILKNFRELIVKAAEIRPIVFVLEDLHWADLTSINLLESLYRLAENNHVLFINVMRPDYKETGERILRTIRNRYPDYHASIYLKPLDANQCETLIGNLLNVRALPAHIRELIAKRAEGNPFFIEEVARSFIDEGVVEIEDGHFRVTEKIDSVVIPETINEVIMARVDRLDEQTKSLLKIASVIGRNFFYKILTEVASTIEEIDDKLEYLKEVQLIKEHRRMKELEYLFKHALAREAVYDSILLNKRKQLHLNVARSIESVFSARIHEFYGMLAFHFILGEELDKAEEYLIKAGEEALKSSASNEALHYYQEALHIYLVKHGKSADQEKVAALEKNIALALYNKGHMEEAVKYFDRALKYWGEKRPKNKITMLINLLADLSNIIRYLYFPSKKVKKIPPRRMNDIVDFTHKRGTVLTSVDNYRMFVDSIGLLRKLNKIDVSKVTKGASMYIHGSALFAYSGISFKISKKLLDYPKDYLKSGDKKFFIDYKFGVLMYGILSGHWTKELEYSQTLVDDCLKYGDLWTAMAYTYWSGVLQVEQGNFSGINICIEKLEEMGDLYEHDLAQARRYTVSTRKFLKYRELHQALHDAEKGISLSDSVGQHLNLLNFTGIKANIQILLGEMEGAENSLKQGREIISHEKRITPWHISSQVLSEFMFYIKKLEESIKSKDITKTKHFRKKAYQSKKAALKISKKYAPNRTETLRLIGVFYWLIKKYNKALTWYAESARVGEKLGASSELSRTYLEIGKRLHGRKGKFQQVNGMGSEEYLEKARFLFKKMEFERDLKELHNLKNYNN